MLANSGARPSNTPVGGRMLASPVRRVEALHWSAVYTNQSTSARLSPNPRDPCHGVRLLSLGAEVPLWPP